MAEHPSKRVYQRFTDIKWADWYQTMLGAQGPQQAFYILFQYGLFDKFPRLKIVLLESGAGWIGAALDRMDAPMGPRSGIACASKKSRVFIFSASAGYRVTRTRLRWPISWNM